ncbi:hypothetical protein ACFU93_40660 [Streptomyces sp. NPDC057611]|uniref:hypothetical protein n=1 Tax=Streptomyces sp. NPDC057611 TaxID=3346182 RepID=UPI0036A58B3F
MHLETYGGVWSDVLNQADRVLCARPEQDAGGDEQGPLQSIVTMMNLARRSAAKGDFAQATTALNYWETLALHL